MKRVLILLLLACCPLFACVYSAKLRAYQRAVDKYIADPTPTNAAKVCNIWTQIGIKFKGDPNKPQPALPAGVNCGAGNGGGNGRGGFAGGVPLPGAPFGVGGVIGHIGDAHMLDFWIRNHSDLECLFSWTIIPDPLNPPGFSFTSLSGSILVPARGTVPVPFEVIMGAGLMDGDVGMFRVEIIDNCSGLPLPDDTAEFQVKASADCSVLPNSPFILVGPGTVNQASWTLTNYRVDMGVTKSFGFAGLGDPASLVALNNGTAYFVPNIFPADKSVTGGMVTVPPGSSVEITWDDLLPSEFCDPQMIGCCALVMDDVPVVFNLFNDMELTPERITPELVELSLVSVQPLGPEVVVEMPPFQFHQPTTSGPLPLPIPEIIDGLTQQMLQQSSLTNGFNISVMVMEDALTIFRPQPPPPLFMSLDPALQWTPILAPFQDVLPEWGVTRSVLDFGRIVNGWQLP
ncbi:MAG: hypothetical protein KDC35_05700 [Acidobacteria bacterium]|nr:hypothetical protein [Acidobacteriota bacterium]